MDEKGNFEKIIEVSYSLISENGYDATSINEIAKKAGVSKGAIYHYFDSKESLFLEVVKNRFKRMNLEEVYQSFLQSKESFIKTIEFIGDNFINKEHNDETLLKFKSEILIQALRNEKVRLEVSHYMQEGLKKIKQLLVKGKELGAVKQEIDVNIYSQRLFLLFNAFNVYKTIGVNIEFERIFKDLKNEFIK